MTTEKAMTFADLKAALDKMSPEALAQPARWWGDERGGVVEKLDALDEDYVNFGEGFEPWSTYTDDPDVSRDEAIAELPKGTPILGLDR